MKILIIIGTLLFTPVDTVKAQTSNCTEYLENSVHDRIENMTTYSTKFFKSTKRTPVTALTVVRHTEGDVLYGLSIALYSPEVEIFYKDNVAIRLDSGRIIRFNNAEIELKPLTPHGNLYTFTTPVEKRDLEKLTVEGLDLIRIGYLNREVTTLEMLQFKKAVGCLINIK